MASAPFYKNFSGKRFKTNLTTGTRDGANKAAVEMRRGGYDVRVVKNKEYGYAIYIRKSGKPRGSITGDTK